MHTSESQAPRYLPGGAHGRLASPGLCRLQPLVPPVLGHLQLQLFHLVFSGRWKCQVLAVTPSPPPLWPLGEMAVSGPGTPASLTFSSGASCVLSSLQRSGTPQAPGFHSLSGESPELTWPMASSSDTDLGSQTHLRQHEHRSNNKAYM